MKEKMTKKVKILIVAIVVGVLSSLGYSYIVARNTNMQPAVVSETLKQFTVSELSKYNGTDNSLPIYIGYQGNVYDVTAGASYYQEGGSYHYLAGKDSTTDLNMFGGDIIKQKYPVIGMIK